MTKEEKLKKANAAVEGINKDMGAGSVMTLSDKPLDLEVISTGSFHLDRALGVGGLPKGRIIEIYGGESSGKTTIATHVIAEAQKQGGVCAFIDAEHAF
jgi:recombination protein RecA